LDEIEAAALDTDLPDLRGTTLDQLCQRALHSAMEPYREALIGQVERPRPNIGSGPPGRAD
jgi:hypothetical protein